MAKRIMGQCFCGAIRIELEGEPAAMGYCHCSSCRAWAAAPVNAFSLWSPDHLKVTQGADRLGEFKKTERSLRRFCKSCGGHVMTLHPHWNLVDVYTAVIPSLSFEPKVHVHYQETVLPMRDGLTKFKDLPKEMGGTGDTLSE